MALQLADCYGPHDPAEIRSAGYAGVLRYISHQAGKCVTAEEVGAYRQAGLIVGLVFEDAAANPLGGVGQGEADGAFAAAVAREVGYPADCIVFAAVDIGATASQMATVVDYFRGFGGQRSPSGPYGSAAVVSAVATELGEPAWQTAAWSAGMVSPRADLYQDFFGAVFDGNTLLHPLALWGMTDAPPVPAPAPAPKPTPSPPAPVPEEDPEMPLFIRDPASGASYTTDGVGKAWVPDAPTYDALAAKLGPPIEVTAGYIDRLVGGGPA